MIRDQIIAIDQGTTSTRAVRYAADGRVLAVASQPLRLAHPQPGWVEADAEHLWAGVQDCVRQVMDERVAAIGIANQRETILLWDRDSGRALHPAIIWQDRRTAAQCEALRADGAEYLVRARTGLLLDPYFTASKLGWLLDHVPGAAALSAQGRLAAGTVDSFLLWRLTGGRSHLTDATNASRTSLFDIHRLCWDTDLLTLFDIPACILPTVAGNCHDFGQTDVRVTGRPVPITAMAGDQQAAMIGLGSVLPGRMKATYGTGCFLLAHTGDKPLLSRHRLLTTLACLVDGEAAYALEGSIFVAGAALNWLRDGLGIVNGYDGIASLAAGVPDDHGVHLVPAFVGLGAPHWRSDLRASLTGLTLDTGPAAVVRAALEAAAFQTCDLIQAMQADGLVPQDVRIDGGMASNDWFAGYLADMTGLCVDRSRNHEATAWGAARLAGFAAGIWPDPRRVPVLSGLDRFTPSIDDAHRQRRLTGWRAAVHHLLASTPPPEGT